MKLMRIYSDKFAASLELNGQGELVEAKSNTPEAPPIALLTGHVLPMPNVAEVANVHAGGVENYVHRVRQEAGVKGDGGVNVFAMQMGGMLNPVYAVIGQPKPDGSNWPLIADAFWDRRLRKDSPYLTPEERAREQQAAQGNWGGNVPTPAPQPPATGGETDVEIGKE